MRLGLNIMFAVLLGLVARCAHADVTITLKPVARVAVSQTLSLGDIARIQSDDAETQEAISRLAIPINAPASQPPSGLRVTVVDIETLLRASSVHAGAITLRGDACNVLFRTASARQEPDDKQPNEAVAVQESNPGIIVQDHVRFRIEKMLGVPSNRLDIVFEAGDHDFLNRSAEGLTIDARTTGFGRRTPLRVLIYSEDGSIEERSLRVGVRILRDVARAKASIRRGQIIARGDIRSEEVWMAPDDAFSEPVSIAGRKARRGIKQGDLLDPSNLEEPIAIERGDLVVVHVVSGSVVLRQESRALESGRLGQRIRLEPVRGGADFVATVEAAGRAVIVTGRPANARQQERRTSTTGALL